MLYGQLLIKEANQRYTAPEEGSWPRAGKHGLIGGLSGALFGGAVGTVPGLMRGDIEAAQDGGLMGLGVGGLIGAGVGGVNGIQKESPVAYFLRVNDTNRPEAIDLIAQHHYQLNNPKADMSKTNLNHPHYNYVKPLLDNTVNHI